MAADTITSETSRARRLSAALTWPRLVRAALVAAIAIGAFAIRAWTVRGGLPYVDHPDEPNPIDYVVRMLQTHDPNPHAFQKPSLYVYLLLAVLSAHYRWGLAAGRYGPIDQMHMTTHLFTTIPDFFIWGRLLTSALAALTVVYVYRLGRRVGGVLAGLLAALLLALSPFHMRHSQYVATDVAGALLVLLALGASVAVARAGRRRDYLAAGAFAGLAASTKYNAGVAALMVVAAHLIYWMHIRALSSAARPPASTREAGAAAWRPSRLKRPPVGAGLFRASLFQLPRLVAAGAAALLGFVAGTPYAVLSWGEFRRGVLGQVKDYGETAHGDFTGAWNLRGYLDFFGGEGLGWVVVVATLAGLALLLGRPHSRRGDRARALALLWISFAVPYLLLHLAQTSHFTRNMMPLVVLSALPAGVAGAALIAWLARSMTGLAAVGERRRTSDKRSRRRRTTPALSVVEGFVPGRAGMRVVRGTIALGVTLALLLPSALETWGYTARLRRGDTRVHALAWIAANVPPGVRVAAELRPLPGPLESPWAETPALPRRDLAWYRRQGYGYLVASSDAWRQWPIPAAYMHFAGRPPVAEFGGPDPHAMLGPHLAIYTTGLSAADVPQPVGGAARVGGARLLGLALGRPDPQMPGVVPARQFKAGETVGLRTFWRVEQPFDHDFFIFIHLVDTTGATVAQRDAPPWQGRFRTTSWRAGAIVADVNDLPLPPGLGPGIYTLQAGMFDPATGAHPPMSIDGRPVATIPLAQITIEP